MARPKCALGIMVMAVALAAAALSGCARPLVKMPEPMPDAVRAFKAVGVYGGTPGMHGTGLTVREGDVVTIMAVGSIDFGQYSKHHDVRPEMGWPLLMRIGKDSFYSKPLPTGVNAYTRVAMGSGELYLGYKCGPLDSGGSPVHPEWYQRHSGGFQVTVIVWKGRDWTRIAEVLERMHAQDPDNHALTQAYNKVDTYRKVILATRQTEKEIAATEKRIKALSQTASKPEIASSAVKPSDRVKTGRPPEVPARAQEEIGKLQTKLDELKALKSELEATQQALEEERSKRIALAEKLDAQQQRETDLMTRLEKGAQAPPVVVIASPGDGSEVEVNVIQINGVAEDDQGLSNLEIYVNGRKLEKGSSRGILVAGTEPVKRHAFRETIQLVEGANRIRVRAVDSDGLVSERLVTVHNERRRRNVWAVVVGINAYQNVRRLKYAVDDARAFYLFLRDDNGIPEENLTLLLDGEATLGRLRSTLGTQLKRRAAADDTVIIYFAGHGATERDALNPDGDGLEKYLLPWEADPADLYASALPMREIAHIFQRIRAERLIFLVDSCYSGASGGRTVALEGLRANISEAFLDRISGGKGRVILSASSVNEVSVEKDELGHGVFTYFLLKGLRGAADTDADKLVSVEEVYSYLSRHVPEATGQEQHPVKKGMVEGRLVLGFSR